MTDGIEIKVSGISEINRSLYRYSQQLGDKVMIDSLKAGAKLVQKDARSRAPKKSGLLRRSIVVRKSKKFTKYKTPGKLGVYLTINKKKAFYGRFLEVGWKSCGPKKCGRNGRVGKKVRALRFIDRAFLSRRRAAVDLIIKAMKRGEEIVRKRTRGIR